MDQNAAPADLPEPPETDPARRARHLATLKRMAEIGMRLLEAAATQAELEMQPATPEVVQAFCRHHPIAEILPRTDPGVMVTRYSTLVRASIGMEARIAAGLAPARIDPQTDPRRPALRRALRQAAEAKTDAADLPRLRRLIEDRLNTELAADPAQSLEETEILEELKDQLGLGETSGADPAPAIQPTPAATPRPVPSPAEIARSLEADTLELANLSRMMAKLSTGPP